MRALDTGIFSVTIVDTITDAAGGDQFEVAIKSLGRESLDRVVEAVRSATRALPITSRWASRPRLS